MSLRERINKQNTTKPPVSIVKPKNIEKLKANAVIKNQKDDLDVLEDLFKDETISAIYINGAKNIYIQKRGNVFKSSLTFKDNTKLLGLLRKSAKLRGIELDELNPFINFKMAEGIFLDATIPPITNVPVVNIKFYRQKHSKISKILEDRAISKEMALTLEAIIASANENILIIGKKNTFKTTLLSALARKFPKNLRANLADFKDEIKFPTYDDSQNDFPYDFENFTYYDFDKITKNYTEAIVDGTLESMFDTTVDRLFFNSPDEKALSRILKAIEEGQKGIVMTLKADSLDDAIKKLIFILLKNNPTITYKKAKVLLYRLFNIAIVVGFDDGFKRKVESLTELVEEEGEIKANDVFFLNPFMEHQSSGFVPEFYKRIDPNFVSLGVNIFDANYKHTYDKSYETIEEIPYKVTNEVDENGLAKKSELETDVIKRRTNRQLQKSAKDNLEKLKQKVLTAGTIENKIIDKKEEQLQKVVDDEFDDEI